MTQIVSSISAFEIYAPSAGHAPTNSPEVSAIASGYQVVSSTATQLYAGSAYLTSVNGAPVSASRAGNAANASMANSAYYDGTGRLISALPDSAAVSSIASSYAESAASSKLDSTAQVVTATAGNGTYVTSINGMEISGHGGGGAQVVTATGSASALSGWYPYTTSYLVSSINGSALLPYGYSALSANSANWNGTRTTVMNNSSNWNSVYDTVSGNSASWNGGSVASPSGTIVVNGSNIEGTNSAVLTAAGEGFETVFFPVNTHIGPQMAMLAGNSVPGTGATLMMPLEQTAYSEFKVILSGNGDYGYVSASGTIPMGTLTASIPMEGITGAISASADQWFNLSNGVSLTARKDGGTVVTGIGELAWKSAVDSVTNTVAMNSAEWGQGGVSPVTVSGIASAYAESAASSKLDTSAFNSGDFYSTSNPSGFITGVDLSNYATTGYVESSVSGKLDMSAFNSSDFYSTANPSGFITGVDLTPYQPTSAMSAYATTAYVTSGLSGKEDEFNAGTGLEFVQSGSDRVLQVEAPVDIVAGPGIVIDNPDGNTLRVSTEADAETMLYDGALPSFNNTITLSEPLSNFEYIDVSYSTTENPYITRYATALLGASRVAFKIGWGVNYMLDTWLKFTPTNDPKVWTYVNNTVMLFKNNDTSLTIIQNDTIYVTTSRNIRIVGIHRIAGGN